MITNFPNSLKHFKKIINQSLEKSKNEGLVSITNKKKFYEGDKMGIIDSLGNNSIQTFNSFESGFSLKKENLTKSNPDLIGNKIIDMKKDISDQIEKNIINELMNSSKDSGVAVGKDGDFLDSFLEMTEKLNVTFTDDDRSKPENLTIVTSPEMFKKMKEEELKYSEEFVNEYNRKREIILDKKYEEYIDNLNNRKIID